MARLIVRQPEVSRNLIPLRQLSRQLAAAGITKIEAITTLCMQTGKVSLARAVQLDVTQVGGAKILYLFVEVNPLYEKIGDVVCDFVGDYASSKIPKDILERTGYSRMTLKANSYSLSIAVGGYNRWIAQYEVILL